MADRVEPYQCLQDGKLHGMQRLRVHNYSPITTRGTLADRFILRSRNVVPHCRLLPHLLLYFCYEFTKLKTCFSVEHMPKRGENTSAEGIAPKMP